MCLPGMNKTYTYPQLARRHITAEERQARAALLLRPARGRRDLPPDLTTVWPSAATGDFRCVPRVAPRSAQAVVQEGRERGHGARRAKEGEGDPAVVFVGPLLIAARFAGRAGVWVVRLGVGEGDQLEI